MTSCIVFGSCKSQMVSWLCFVFVAVFVAGCNAVDLYLGDACTIVGTRETGVCKSLKDCQTARVGVKLGKIPQHCIFEGSVPVVCCVASRSAPPPNTGLPASAPRVPYRTVTKDSQATCRNKPITNGAVKIRKTGQKAWDKCIDLADSVYPCGPSSFTVNAVWVRNYACAHSATTLIVGGVVALPGEFPHMAALGVMEEQSTSIISWYCGGSLISDQWVLTAAHCLTKGQGSPVSHVRLSGGDNNVTPRKENLFTVIAREKHPDYNRPVKYNDIALLKLDRKVIFSRETRPACLHTGDEINNEKAIATGWGSAFLGGKASNNLLKTTVEKFDLEACRETHPPIKTTFRLGVQDDTQVCYGHSTLKQDTCQGDSGGPLQIYNDDKVDCTYLVFAITSTGKICGEPGYPAIYTRVSAFIPWIEGIVWPGNETNT